jgi:type II restriction enzyme
MNAYSSDGSKHKEFELVIADAFNLFKEIKAERVGGAGETDVKCKHLLNNWTFAIEAKSTGNKLSGIENATLREHREKFGAKFTILMTPEYMPKVGRHIKNDFITILKPVYLSEYLSNYYRDSSNETSFEELNELIENNMGEDISEKLSTITISRYGNTT